MGRATSTDNGTNPDSEPKQTLACQCTFLGANVPVLEVFQFLLPHCPTFELP